MIAAAFLAGLMGSPHCVAMCGGFATACARPRGGLVFWHAGRLTTYALLGAVAGATGGALPGPGWLLAAVAVGLLVWSAAALGGLAPQPRIRIPGLARIGQRLAGEAGPGARFAFGMTTGLLPCGMVYAALGIAVASAHPAAGAASMVAFGLGTVPALTALSAGVRRLAARSLWHRRGVALLVLVAGLWSVGARTGLLGAGAGPRAAHDRHAPSTRTPSAPALAQPADPPHPIP